MLGFVWGRSEDVGERIFGGGPWCGEHPRDDRVVLGKVVGEKEEGRD